MREVDDSVLAMINYLTHKLRTQSLNESDPFQCKPQEDNDRDSGTESDDEGDVVEELQKYMENRMHYKERKDQHQFVETLVAETGECKDTICELRRELYQISKTEVDRPLPEPIFDSAFPRDSDHNLEPHSSEDELGVINCTNNLVSRGRSSSTYPEKRKWSQANCPSFFENSGSSDDEIRDLLCFSAPVEFCASPPANIHKPNQSLSPPLKILHLTTANIPALELCSSSNTSSRKKHRQTLTNSNGRSNIHRPCLDFEKMQQPSGQKEDCHSSMR
ncbi:uncharacterized protein LOC106466313 isoform X2 [Limulus polyphemus]|uniref:Uncharacterized protein LOC106466313 isoform X2 n=1 Tax=Limulus polyphemus TaxID=6850 RepID=A0ABM1T290_LIMPO|nr:uncharacterized protein LOC106466313 isoform X2 [Limulus polyphemus]